MYQELQIHKRSEKSFKSSWCWRIILNEQVSPKTKNVHVSISVVSSTQKLSVEMVSWVFSQCVSLLHAWILFSWWSLRSTCYTCRQTVFSSALVIYPLDYAPVRLSCSASLSLFPAPASAYKSILFFLNFCLPASLRATFLAHKQGMYSEARSLVT